MGWLLLAAFILKISLPPLGLASNDESILPPDLDYIEVTCAHVTTYVGTIRTIQMRDGRDTKEKKQIKR